MCLIDVDASDVVGAFETTDDCVIFKSHLHVLNVVYFVTDLVLALTNKENHVNIIKFSKYLLAFIISYRIQIVKDSEHETPVVFIVHCIMTMLFHRT